MSETKPTKGPCVARGYYVEMSGGVDIGVCRMLANIGQPAEANAIFVAEAFTVYFEAGKTPRQLAEDKKKLVEMLGEVRSYVYMVAAKYEGAFPGRKCGASHDLADIDRVLKEAEG